jgi:hypothetical protein
MVTLAPFVGAEEASALGTILIRPETPTGPTPAIPAPRLSPDDFAPEAQSERRAKQIQRASLLQAFHAAPTIGPEPTYSTRVMAFVLFIGDVVLGLWRGWDPEWDFDCLPATWARAYLREALNRFAIVNGSCHPLEAGQQVVARGRRGTVTECLGNGVAYAVEFEGGNAEVIPRLELATAYGCPPTRHSIREKNGG